jgi:preprotein translocase subunit SecF
MKQTSGTATSKAAASRGPAGPVAPPHFTELISPNPGIDFLRWAPIAIAATWFFILAGLASVWWHGGLNYGIDFAGGTLVQVRFAEPASIADVRASLT